MGGGLAWLAGCAVSLGVGIFKGRARGSRRGESERGKRKEGTVRGRAYLPLALPPSRGPLLKHIGTTSSHPSVLSGLAQAASKRV